MKSFLRVLPLSTPLIIEKVTFSQTHLKELRVYFPNIFCFFLLDGFPLLIKHIQENFLES